MKRFTVFAIMLLVAASVACHFALADEAGAAEPDILMYNGFEYEVGADNKIRINAYLGNDTEIVIPAEIDGIPVAYLSSDAFSENKTITSVTIPGSIAEIPYGAFLRCSSLRNVVLEHGVRQLGYRPSFGIIRIPGGAFQGCSSLVSITIPDSVTFIGAYSFSNCGSLKDIVLPDSVSVMMQNAFAYCSSLESIEIPATDLGSDLFYHCENLKRIVLPPKLREISRAMLDNCTSLARIEIPETVHSIGDSAFSGCTSLTEVLVPESVTSIGSRAFSGCTSLAEVLVPESVASIGFGAFRATPWLDSFSDEFVIINHHLLKYNGLGGVVIIPDGTVSIASAFASDDRITAVTLPGSVQNIDNEAFMDCIGLTAVNLLDGVSSIGSRVFSGCTALTDIRLPDSMTAINFGAFKECISLTTLTLPRGVNTIAPDAFSGCEKLKAVYFEGAAPTVTAANEYQASFSGNAEGFTVYYRPGAEGFTSPTWEGYASAEYTGDAPGVLATGTETPTLAESAVPAEYIGTWAGSVGNISLVFAISADSRAVFTFTQGNYTGTSDVALSVEDGTFTVEVPEDDALGTVSCGGTYAYHDGILTLAIENTFANGGVFAYTVPCERAEDLH